MCLSPNDLDFRYGSLADIREHIGDVRFTLESRHTDSHNNSFAAVCFPHAPTGPTCGLKGGSRPSHPSCTMAVALWRGASAAGLGCEKAPGMLDPRGRCPVLRVTVVSASPK